MAWVRKTQTAPNPAADANLVGLELNATAARAVYGPAPAVPRPLPLEDAQEILPMALNLEGRQPRVGRAGSSLCRISPHLACSDFLAHLGDRREWAVGRHRLDAARAVSLVLEKLQEGCAGARAVVATTPAYLSRGQASLLPPLAQKVRLPLVGTIRAPLAAALTAYGAVPWSGPALVLDVDGHALAATTVVADGEQLWAQAEQAWPQLNLRAWKGRLLDLVADRCVRQSRRDPRDCAPAEQALYDQLDDALDAAQEGRVAELLIQTTNWYHNLLLRPDELAAACARLVKQTTDGVRALLAASAGREAVHGVILTATAGRLPGLAAALQDFVQESAPVAGPVPSEEDFGIDLLPATSGPALVSVLAPDALARAAHAVSVRLHRGELAAGHLDLSVLLPAAGTTPPAPPGKPTFRILSADQE